jgi:hypothetical protein
MVRNNLYAPEIKLRICKRCGNHYIGGKTSNYCEKCKLPLGVYQGNGTKSNNL